MEALTQATLMSALVLSFALVIERILEVLKAAYDLIDSKFDYCHFWTRHARKTQQYLERRLRVLEYVNPKVATTLLNRFSDLLLGKTAEHSGELPVLCGDLVRAAWVKVAMKSLGAAIGVWLAWLYQLNLLVIVQNDSQFDKRLGIVLTGLAMGFSSSLVHKLITALERKRDNKLFEAPGNV